MKIKILCALGLLMLTACAEGTPVPGDLAALNAQATLAVITERARETQAAAIEATRQAGVASAKLAAEAALISTQAAVRQQDLQAQLTAQSLEDDRATATAAPLKDTQIARMTQPAFSATATSIAVASNIAAEGERRARIMTWIYPAGWLLICAVLALSLWNLANLAIAQRDRKSRVLETRSGTLIFVWNPYAQDFNWTLLERHIRNLDTVASQADEAPAVQVSPGGIVARSPLDQGNRARALVVQLLRRAQEIGGDDSLVLPGQREMGWTSSKWQYVMGIIKDSGLGYSDPGKGSYIARQWGTARDILYALDTNQIQLKLSPTPKGRLASDQGARAGTHGHAGHGDR